MSELKQIFTKRSDAKDKIIDGKAIIINLESGSYFLLNETGSRLWQLLDGKRNVKEIVKKIHSEFEAEQHIIEKDVSELIAKLEKEGLVEQR